MKKNSLLLLALCFFILKSHSQTYIQNVTIVDTLIVATPETLVQQQVNAFNARNIAAFLAPYADSIELYNFPDKLLGKGKEMMRQQYGGMFKQFPNLHCEIKGRIIKGNFVVDHESVSGFGQPENMEAIAIYEIEGDKIVKAWFVR